MSSLPLRGYHPLWHRFPDGLRVQRIAIGTGPQHHISYLFPSTIRFGLFPFHSPLLRESRFAFFSCAYLNVFVQRVPRHYCLPSLFGTRRDSHSGIPGSKACMRLPGAYGSLPPPSSALEPSHPPAAFWRVGSTETCPCRHSLPEATVYEAEHDHLIIMIINTTFVCLLSVPLTPQKPRSSFKGTRVKQFVMMMCCF